MSDRALEGVSPTPQERRPPHPVRVLHLLPDLQMGGGQQVLQRHIEAMSSEYVEHHVASFLPADEMAPAFRKAGAILHPLGPWSWLTAPVVLVKLIRLIGRESIDVLHTNGTPVDLLHGLLASLMSRVPHVTTLHGMRLELGSISLRPRSLLFRAWGGLGRLLTRRLMRLTRNRVIAVSDSVLENWKSYLRDCLIPASAAEVVYSGVPVYTLASGSDAAVLRDLRNELSLPDAAPLLISISRLVPSKRNSLLIPILQKVRARVPEVRLLVVGEGPERETLEKRTAEAGLEDAISYIGQRSDVPRLLELADVLVFPSNREGFGLVALEALAAGTPVVASNLPSLQLLEDQGLAVQRIGDGSASSFSDAITRLLFDRAATRALGERSREIVARHWDIRASARRYERIYLEVSGRSPAGDAVSTGTNSDRRKIS